MKIISGASASDGAAPRSGAVEVSLDLPGVGTRRNPGQQSRWTRRAPRRQSGNDALQSAVRDKMPDAEIKLPGPGSRNRKASEAKLSKAQEDLRASQRPQEAVAVVFGPTP